MVESSTVATATGTALYSRLSAFYLFYFASIGVLVPFWSLYLQSLGLGAPEIGALVATVMATKLVAPYVWGTLADRRGARMPIIRLASLAALVCFTGVFLGSGFAWLVLVMLSFSFFWNATLPQFEAVTFNHLGQNSHRYANIRVWGSVGFVLSSVALGPLLERYGPGVVPVAVAGLFVCIWLSAHGVPERALVHSAGGPERLLPLLRQPVVLSLFTVCFLIQASHGPYYGFFSIYLEARGLSRTVIGVLWALGVVAEVLVFLLMHRLLPRFGARLLMLATLALTVLRWLLIGWGASSMVALVVAQCLHAFSFGLYHAVAISLINRFFRGRVQGRGQALYSSLSFGAGGSLGALLGGQAWDSLGPHFTFTAAALAAALGWVIAWLGLHPERFRAPAETMA